jgi:hypothetical protein
METAGDIINGSLRLLGVLAEGEVPSAETSQDALRAMNQMIDSWNTERLSVFSTQDQSIHMARQVCLSAAHLVQAVTLLATVQCCWMTAPTLSKTPALASATASK